METHLKSHRTEGVLSMVDWRQERWSMDMQETVMAEHGVPEIINSDQGSQYTNPSSSNYLDATGRATDNIWIERFWKTIKFNHIYLNPCDTGLELIEGVQTYYN